MVGTPSLSSAASFPVRQARKLLFDKLTERSGLIAGPGASDIDSVSILYMRS